MNRSLGNVVKTADAVTGSWVYKSAPASMRPWLKLARMDRPAGTWLLLWPCLWSILLASDVLSYNTVQLGILFGIGALVMRGAGCTYNDIIDRDFDDKVDRTASRPIPAGEISIRQAWLFLAGQCSVGLIVLLQLNITAIYLGIGSLALVAAYPFMKRITWWPQAWLGLTFNWGALMGYAAVAGEVSAASLVLYAGCMFWTLGYDTIYAHQDKEDDALIGVKSSARKLGDQTRLALAIFYGIFIIALLVVAGLESSSSILYIGVCIALGHLVWQVTKLRIDDAEACLQIFRSNTHFGWIIFIALLLETVSQSCWALI